jgi:nitric oxide reductase activation protein
MEQAGSGFAIARRIRIGHSGMTVFAVTPQLEVQEGGRVVFGRSASFAVVGGVAALAALLVALLRRR